MPIATRSCSCSKLSHQSVDYVNCDIQGMYGNFSQSVGVFQLLPYARRAHILLVFLFTYFAVDISHTAMLVSAWLRSTTHHYLFCLLISDTLADSGMGKNRGRHIDYTPAHARIRQAYTLDILICADSKTTSVSLISLGINHYLTIISLHQSMRTIDQFSNTIVHGSRRLISFSHKAILIIS